MVGVVFFLVANIEGDCKDLGDPFVAKDDFSADA